MSHVNPLHYFTPYFYEIIFCIVSYLGFAWLIRRVLDLMIEFIVPLYNWLQQFTNHYLTHSSSYYWTLHWNYSDFQLNSVVLPFYSVVLLQFCSEQPLTVPSYNSSAWTSRKTPSSVVKSSCVLVRYLAMDALLLLRAYAMEICFTKPLPSNGHVSLYYHTI
jgi:hypothetical protein